LICCGLGQTPYNFDVNIGIGLFAKYKNRLMPALLGIGGHKRVGADSSLKKSMVFAVAAILGAVLVVCLLLMTHYGMMQMMARCWLAAVCPSFHTGSHLLWTRQDEMR